ncbi:polysaccharide deacetylase family protein [Niallia sp. XMNu-256]|uniref:polysaccharide deacetylase family protein n=1 Tax=Niallia sp. XMNu-256 TaxID=3082444 RepID=UPI0030D13467
MKKIIILLLINICIVFLPTQAFAQKRVPILVYHSIDEYKGSGSQDLYVTPKNFETQIKYLRDHGFTLLTFENWQDINHVDKPIFITFDDAYKNNINAFRVFQKLQNQSFKPKGTIFVISDFIGRSNRLTTDELKMMVKSGFISVQSHTATHPDLTKISNYEKELKKSKEKIEQITGKPVIALAYPYGKFNNKVVEETKKYYQYGLTTIPSPYVKSGIKNEMYYLPRIYVKYFTTLDEFAKIVEGA